MRTNRKSVLSGVHPGRQTPCGSLSPLLLGISNLTVTVGREITNTKSPHGTLQVSYTNAITVPEVIEAHTGYAESISSFLETVLLTALAWKQALCAKAKRSLSRFLRKTRKDLRQ
jgi:hypothetical protein